MALKLDLSSTKDTKNADGKEGLNYVVAVDESNCAKHAFRWARFVANPKDKVTIIHSFTEKLMQKCVEERYTKYAKDGSGKFQLQMLGSCDDKKQDDPNQRITKFVNEKKPTVDMLVTGMYGATHEKKQPDFKMADQDKKSKVGSTSDLSLRRAQCSSFFVRREVDIPDDQNLLKICVGVDGSLNSRHAFEFALKLLAPKNKLYLVHVVTDNVNEAEVPEQYRSKNVYTNYVKKIEEAQRELGFEVSMEMKMVEGMINISDALCKFAKDNGCQILCVGADGMSAHCNGKAILGSVSDECVKDCECNVIVTQINQYCSTPRKSFHAK